MTISSITKIIITPIPQLKMHKLSKNPLLGYYLKNQTTFIVLDIHKSTPILDYTFLQSNLQQLPAYLKPFLHEVDFMNSTKRNIGFYLDQVQRLEGKLKEIQGQEIQAGIVRDRDVLGLVKLFREVKKSVNQEASICLGGMSENVNNVQQLSFLSSALNILQLPLWNKLLMSSSQVYKKLSIPTRQILLQSFKTYITKYSISGDNKFNPYKFLMKQNHLHDIIDIDYFLQFTKQSTIFPDQNQDLDMENLDFGTCFNLFKNRIQIIRKFSKSVNVNFYQLRAEYRGLLGQVRENLDFMSIDDLLLVYNFYVKISACDDKFVEQVEEMIMKRLQYQNKKQMFYYQNIYKIILDTWKINGRYNPKMWKMYIQPFFSEGLGRVEKEMKIKDGSVNTWSNVAYNIIASNIKDTDLPERIISLLNKQSSQKNRTNNIITEYLKIKQLQKQNKNLSHLLPQLLKTPKNPTPQKTQVIQYNPTQQFWFNIIKGVLPQQSIYKSQYISTFQIDILVQYKGKYFAFEIQGSHYRFGKNQSGKKMVKEVILKCYGITTIVINCAESFPKLIMRLRFVLDGQRYIRELLEKYYLESLGEGEKKIEGSQ